MPSERLSFTRFCWTTVDEAPSNSTPSKLRAKQLQNAVPFDESRNSRPSLGASTTFRNMTRMFVDLRTSMASLLAEVTVEVRSPGRRPSAGHLLPVLAGAMPVMVRFDRRSIKTGPAQRPVTVIVAPLRALSIACCRSSKTPVTALRTVTVTAQGSSVALPQSLSQASCDSAASAGQSSWTPSQLSGVSQGPAAGRHTAVLLVSPGQSGRVPVHASATSQSPAAGRHTVVEGLKPSAGQLSCTPSHCSASSQGPADDRHTAMLLASAGHAGPVPVHFSAMSHSPDAGRHTVVEGLKPSAGQLSWTPSHCSAASQGPAEDRHSAVLLASTGQSGPVPVQKSSTSQAPAAGRQSVLLGAKASAGQSSRTPSQLSAVSHGPAAGRHSAVLLASVGQPGPVPVQKSSTSQAPAAGRQSMLLGAKASAGQSSWTPSQLSATSQAPAAGPHTAGPLRPAGRG